MTEKIPSRPLMFFGAKRKHDAVTIRVAGRERPAIFIGNGRFTTAFAISEQEVILYTHFGDMSKEILAQVNHKIRNDHIPKIERVDSLAYVYGNNEADVLVYKAKRYRPFKRINCEAKVWNEHLELMKVRKLANNVIAPTAHPENTYVAINSHVSEPLKQALKWIAIVSERYGPKGYLFDDFRARNLALGNRGQLIILDAVFDWTRI